LIYFMFFQCGPLAGGGRGPFEPFG
jgi:hypothetical protein